MVFLFSRLKADCRNTYHLDTKTCFSLFDSFDFFPSGRFSCNGAFLLKAELAVFKTPCGVLNFELVTVHCFSVSGNDHFRHHVLRCTSIDITWHKFPPLFLFLLGTSYLVRKAKLSEEKPLPCGQRVRRPRSVSRAHKILRAHSNLTCDKNLGNASNASSQQIMSVVFRKEN